MKNQNEKKTEKLSLMAYLYIAMIVLVGGAIGTTAIAVNKYQPDQTWVCITEGCCPAVK